MKDAASLRRELDRIGTRRGRCVPPELKARAREWLLSKRAEGYKVTQLAAELGISMGTALQWSKNTVRAIVPVRVLADEASASVTVVSRSGLRVEGMSLEQVVHVLRELG